MNELIKRITNQRHTTDKEFEDIIRQELNNFCRTIPNDSDLGKVIRKQ